MASVGSDSSLDDFSNSDSWETELEIALLKNASLAEVKSICQLRRVPSRLRRDFWRLCLRVESTSGGMSSFTDIFDLQCQEQLHSECDKAAAEVLSQLSQMDTSETDIVEEHLTPFHLSSVFESILTHFSQTYSIPFVPGNGWIQILSTLYIVLRPDDREDLYLSFTSVYHRFIASGTRGSLHACNAFRLLLQYHEPELCNFLDSHKLGPEMYAKAWFDSLFAGSLSNDALSVMWDYYFLLGEPQFGMFVALILLVNAKDSLMQKENVIGQEITEDTFSLGDSDDDGAGDSESVTVPPKSRDEILVKLRSLPSPMQPTDLPALVDITRVYAHKTPTSFYTHYLSFLFGTPTPGSDDGNHLVDGALTLLVSVEEVLSVAQASTSQHHPPRSLGDIENKDDEEEGVRFLLVDCRPADQYNAGHLATAFYLDTELMLSNPPEFNTSVQALLQTQQRGIASGSLAVGEHIVFMGSGRQAEDRVANMVIAHFLRLNTPYVSMVDGGYAAFHEALGPVEFNRFLVSHDEDLCFICASNRGQAAIRMAQKASPTQGSLSIPRSAPIPPLPSTQPLSMVFSKFSNLLKKSSPSRVPQNKFSNAPAATQSVQKQTSYRNTAAVFSIDDNDEDDESPEFDLRPNPSGPLPISPSSKGKLVPVVTSLDICQPGQLINLQSCSTMPGVKQSFDCTLIGFDEMPSFKGVILLLERSMVVVREREKQFLEALSNLMQKTFLKKSSAPTENDKSALDGVIEVVFPLTHITKITSKKITPEIITFHCIRPGEDLVSETQEAIRLLIPKAGDAVKVIKAAVFSTNGIS
nr:Rhodanese [Hymenolepis microstoma]